MKKSICLMLTFLLLLSLALPAKAVDNGRQYLFALSVDGNAEKTVRQGDMITLTLQLTRTDLGDGNTLYAMQDEITYDSAFFALVPGSALVKSGIQTIDIALSGGYRAFYMNFLSKTGGAPWDAATMVGSIKLKVVAASGTSTISNRNYQVAVQDGTDSYSATARDVRITVLPEAWDNPFTDVLSGAWYHRAVQFAHTNGLMQGTSPTQFMPNASTTRAMLATVLYRMAGAPDAPRDMVFPDVKAGKWYTEAISWAAAYEIVKGFPDGTFRPDDRITREQIALMLRRYAAQQGQDVTAADELRRFSDAGNISTWARDAVAWAVAEGLIKGRTTSMLYPKDGATRAEIATVLMRYAET